MSRTWSCPARSTRSCSARRTPTRRSSAWTSPAPGPRPACVPSSPAPIWTGAIRTTVLPSATAPALELIEIAYEELPAVTTLEEALASGAPLVHTAEPLAGHFADLSTLKPRPGTNICHQFHLERGQGAAAFAEADLVFEDTYSFPRVQHYAM